jgi:hypothetical protein
MFRLLLILFGGYVGYTLGQQNALDFTKSYTLKKTTDLGGGGLSTEGFLKIENNEFSFIQDEEQATLFSAESARTMLKLLNEIQQATITTRFSIQPLSQNITV